MEDAKTTDTAEKASAENWAVLREMARIRATLHPSEGDGDREDLITYAKEVVRLRAAPQPAASDVPHDVVEQAARASYEYEGDRKGIDYAGWDLEPENVKRQWRESVTVPLAVALADNARLRAALRNNFCPRPSNHRPDQFDVGQCVDASECGCMNVTALSTPR